MELGAHFSAKLEPFLLMSKSAKGAAACKLISDATAAPGVFVFAELFEQPSIQEVRRRQQVFGIFSDPCFQLVNSEQHSSHYSLLQLFSYKTYGDYIRKFTN